MSKWSEYVKDKEVNFRSPVFQKKFPAITNVLIDMWLSNLDEEPTEYKQQWYRNFIESN